ncbi:MAG: hypothetical protein AAB552_03760 [Patescibacteria group bacterium]
MNGSSAVLIHGLHLGADDWDNIVLGQNQYGKVGRILRGLKVAYEEDAKYIFWGTGASERDGVKEGQYILDYALCHLSEIAAHLSVSYAEAEGLIVYRSVVHTTAQNTRQEIRAVMEFLKPLDTRCLFIVSSPTHGGRCFTEAEVLRLGEFADCGFQVFTVGSDVSYANSGPQDVVIVEPPHRGDRVQTNPLSVTTKRAMKLSRSPGGEAFLQSLSDFVTSQEMAITQAGELSKKDV